MKQSAFDDFSEGTMDVAYEAYDFKTCQRSDGSFYGTAGDCAQKGSKEVKSSGTEKAVSKRASELNKQATVGKAVVPGILDAIAAFVPGVGPGITAGLKAATALTNVDLDKKAREELNKARADGKSKSKTKPKAAAKPAAKPKAAAKPAAKPKAAAKPAAKPKAKAKPKASLTRNASQKEVLDEYRNNLKNGKWTLKQQNYSKSVKESAQRDAVNELVRDGFDPRKILDIFPSLKDNVNRFEYSESALEALDFARCQRPDGSHYGTAGVCRSGASVGAKQKEAKSADKVAKAANKKADAADKAWRKAGSPKGEQQKEVRRLDKEAKAADKAANKADKEYQKAQKKETADRARSQKQKQNAGRTKALKEELAKRKDEMKGASPEKINKLIAEASKAADKTEQLRQINSQEGRGGGAGR